MKKSTTHFILILAVLALTALSCSLFFSPSSDEPAVNQEETASESLAEENHESESVAEVPEPVVERPAIHQWASSAKASSEYGSPGYAAEQATGAPDTPDCGDQESAWASEDGFGVDWLEVSYDIPLIPSEINIYESHTPTQIVKVELLDTSGSYHEIYSAIPVQQGDCPYVLSIPVGDVDYQAVSVKITVDQSKLSLPWDEIDAVQLVGYLTDDTEVTTSDTPEQPSQVEESTQSEMPPTQASGAEIVIPDSTLWRANEDSLGIELGTFGDMAASTDGRIYIPDNRIGVLVFDVDGNQVDTIEHDEFMNPKDIKIGPDGNLYIADYFADSVLIFSPEGEFISKFGESGNGPGQFGKFGPKAIAVGLDNTIYALDDNRDEDDNPFVRILIFSKDGDYLSEVPIDDGFPVGMDVGPDGYLYVVNYFGYHLQKRDAQGNIVAEIGNEALKGTDPQYVDFDDAGNIYITVWDEPGVMILDPQGNLIGRFGYEENPDVSPWPDGAMNQPTGIAVLADGSMVFFSDYANQQPIFQALDLR
jgi:hypothetical protein